jgi:hypothetical protein
MKKAANGGGLSILTKPAMSAIDAVDGFSTGT